MKHLPMVLIIVGVLLLAYWGYDYSQNRETAGVGGLEVTVVKGSTSILPAILGGLSLLAGLGMTFMKKGGR